MEKTSGKILKSVFGNSTFPSMIVSASNRIEFYNSALADLTGYSQSEVPDLGTFMVRVFPESDERERYRNRMLDLINGRSDQREIACSIVDKTGVERTILLKMDCYKNENGDRECLMIFSEITSFIRNAASDDAYSGRIAKIFDDLPYPSLFCDLDGIYRGSNKAFRDFTGLKSIDIFGKKAHDIFPHGYAEVVQKKNSECIKTGKKISYTSFIPRSDGTLPPCDFVSTVYYASGNNPAGVVNTIIEKSGNVNSNDHIGFDLVSIFDRINEIVSFYSPDLSIKWTNRAAVKEFEMTPEEAVGQKCYKVWHNRDEPCEYCHSLDAIRNGEARWTIKRNAKGKLVSLYSYPVYDKNSNPVGIVEIASDYTEFAEIEQKLQMSENKFMSFFESIREGIIILNSEGKVVEFNRAIEKITGVKRHEVIHRHFDNFLYDLVPALDNVREVVHEAFENILNKGLTTCMKKYYKYQLVDSAGINKTIFHMPVPINTGDELLIGNIIRDVSDYEDTASDLKYLRSLEEAIVAISGIFADEFEPDFNRVLELLGTALSVNNASIFDFSGDFSTLNTAYEWVNGKKYSVKKYARDTKLGDSSWLLDVFRQSEIFVIEDVHSANSYPEELIDIMKEIGVKSAATISIKSAGGKFSGFLGVSDFEHPRKWNEHDLKLLKIVSRIISNYRNRIMVEKERETLQSQLMHAQKMESIGRLAGGLAHDFNNIITSIMGFSEMLKLKYADNSTLEGQASDVILKSAVRAQRLTKKLLEFSRREKFQPEMYNINEIIKEAVGMSAKIFDQNTELRLDLKNGLVKTAVDKNQIEQVLTNMLINARDALPNGGEITLSTDSVNSAELKSKGILDLSGERYIRIGVEDNGAGIPEEIRKNIFEPFYTTKKKGLGTGLGLATAYGIIEGHNGHITVDSFPGKGTVFSIYLPVINIRNKKKTAPKEDVVHGDKTILLVDDEEDVRTLGSMMLSSLGYNVLHALDGADAVEKYKAYRDKVDLVLMDMIMPRMSGGEAFEKLKELNPDIKVLLVSGYSKTDKVSKALDNGAIGFLEKPFRRYLISQKVAEALS